MKLISKRHLSLLEVLISLMLISASLPLLFTPFIYATTDQIETVQKLRTEKTSLYYLVTILGELHTGGIPFSQLDGNQEYPFKLEWKGEDWKDLPITGTYRFNFLKKKAETEKQRVELWQMTIEIKDSTNKNSTPSHFTYEFVIKKNNPEAALEKPQETSGET